MRKIKDISALNSFCFPTNDLETWKLNKCHIR